MVIFYLNSPLTKPIGSHLVQAAESYNRYRVRQTKEHLLDFILETH